MPNSAGILVFTKQPELLFFLVHPGGPYYQKKEHGVWTIPKGLYSADENPLDAALREFREETGYTLPQNASYLPLPSVRYKNGKNVQSWAVAHVIPENTIFSSNTFEIEWPPRTKQMQSYPEVDRWAYFPYSQALTLIHPIQVPLLEHVANQI